MHLLLLLATGLITCLPPGKPPIRLTPDMLLNETAYGDVSGLVDEPDRESPTKPFFGGWTAWQYPMQVAIDLGSVCEVEKVRIYNESGGGPISIGTGVPFKWKVQDVALTGFKTWNEFPIGTKTRWLQLTIKQPISVAELRVFGTAGKPTPVRKLAKRRPVPTMDELLGTNAFIDDPIDAITTPVGFVREYHPWGWDVEGPDGARRFEPSGAAGGNSWFFDAYYAKLKAGGVMVCPVIWQSPSPLFNTKSKESKPIAPGADSKNPASYRLHAEHFFQVAARYGSRKVDDSQLDLAPNQPRRSGLGLLRYLENWNEPDKTWEGPEGRFNPYDLAAMSSADYDGDQGRMGKTFGVKNADPTMRLVAGGLAGLNLDMMRAMKFWADHHRSGDFPADAINFHHYSSSSNEQWFQPGGKGISPEDDDLRGKIQRLTDWRDANIPNRELWVTEFGYDTNPKSPLHVPTFGSMNAEHVQAAWIVRSFLALAAARVDRAAQFMLRDVDSKGTGVFATCGLVSEKGSWTRKTSWYFLATMKKHLLGYRFSRVVPSGNEAVWTYEFARADGRRAVVAWCPTSSDKRVTGYRLPFAVNGATVVELADKSTEGVVEKLSGQPLLTISETPTIVLLNPDRSVR